jgi:hypothetical protein
VEIFAKLRNFVVGSAENFAKTWQQWGLWALGLFCSPIILMTKTYPYSILCFGGVLLVVTDHIQG